MVYKKLFFLMLLMVCKTHSQTKNAIDSINQIALDKILNNRTEFETILLKNAADAKKINYDYGLGQSYSILARLAFYAGNLDQNINYSLKAIALFEKTKQREALAIEYGELGFRMKDRSLSKAIRCMQKGKVLAEKFQYNKPLLSIYNNYGVLKKRNEEPDSALYYFKKCLLIKEKIKDSVGIPYSLNNIAEIYLERKQFSDAAILFKKGLNIRLTLKDSYGIADSYAYLGDLFLAEKKYDEAIVNYNKSIAISQEFNYKTLLLHNYKMISECYESSNNAPMALQTYKKHILYKDRILNENTNAKIAELEVRFETNEKEKLLIIQKNEITATQNKLITVALIAFFIGLLGFLLFRQQRFKNMQQKQEYQLKNAIAKIETQNKLQEQRLSISRDLHDNIGAQLTFIISSIENIKHAFPIKDIILDVKLNTISTFTKSTILELRDTIWAMNSNEITFEDLQSRLINFIQKAQLAAEQIDFNFAIDAKLNHIKLSSIQGMNLYRTIQEAVNNAIKHANATRVSIEIISENSSILIVINDNGIGFDEGQITKGNGLYNMKKRISEINGTLNFGRNEQGGSGIEIRLQN